ncbi:MAG: hypothetical protein WCR54_01390 [Clostridia bacterium]
MNSLIAGILIFISSIYLGIGVSNIYKNKVDFYEDLLYFINFCNSEITYYNKTVDQIIEKYNNNNPKSKLIGNIVKDNECIEIYEETIGGIRNLDKDSQQAFFDLQSSKVELAKQKASISWENKGKIYRKISPLVGLGIMILII